MLRAWANYQLATVRAILSARSRREVTDEEISRALDALCAPERLTTEAAARLYGIKRDALAKRIRAAGLRPAGKDARDARAMLWRRSDLERVASRADGRTREGRALQSAEAAPGAPEEAGNNG